MKVSSSSALPLVFLVVACSYASPMFGTGGMMARKFPGATDMTYREYRRIANENAGRGEATPAAAASGVAARAGGAAFVPRTGGSAAGDTTWMFGNGVGAPSSLSASSQPGSSTQSGLSFNQQQASYDQQGQSFGPQDFQDPFEGRYPSEWDPRDSYAFLQFPYHGYGPLDNEDAYVTQNKIYKNYY